jgi:glycosyltransferase involved in cell wall biosynthesis
MKIAWLTPFSRKSAIGEYSASVVRELSTYGDVTVFVSDVQPNGDTWLSDVPMHFLTSNAGDEVYQLLSSYDLIFYNLGDNNLNHQNIFEISMYMPGIVILHDLVMHHFFAEYCLTFKKSPADYLHELRFSCGEEGYEFGQKVIQGTAGDVWSTTDMLRYNMAKSALRGSYGVITHSEFARRAVEEFSGVPVEHIPFPQPLSVSTTNRAFKGVPEPTPGKTRLLTFGVINQNKMVAEVIQAIGERKSLREQVVYHIVGTPAPKYGDKLKQIIERYRLESTVFLLDYQPEDVLHQYLSAADVVINLRNPHFGESSWSLLEAAYLGKPTIVWKHGYYDEFPDSTIAKVTEDTLAATLEELCTNAQLRQRLGASLQEYATATFNTQAYCEKLLRFSEKVRYSQVAVRLADRMSAYLIEMGVYDFEEPVARHVTRELVNLLTENHARLGD